MLDQKKLGEKLRNHRKKLGMTQEDAAEKIGISAQAISKWESGDCLPDCFNLKAISDVYKISADVLLETQSSGDIETVAGKIEQIGTEYFWTAATTDRYKHHLRQELGEDLWKMWKGIYFAEIGNRQKQEECKSRGNLRVIGEFGTKIWDDDGIVSVIQSSLLQNLTPFGPETVHLMQELCSEDGQRVILALNCDKPISKQELFDTTGIELPRLNELLLLFAENRIIEFLAQNAASHRGYLISGHCGIAAHMILAAMYIINKMNYEVSQFMHG